MHLTGSSQDQDKDKAIIERPFASGTTLFLSRNRASATRDFQPERLPGSLLFYDLTEQPDRDRSMAVSGEQLKLTCRHDRVYGKYVVRNEATNNGATLRHELLLEHDDVLELPGLRPIGIQHGVHRGRTSSAPGELALQRLPYAWPRSTDAGDRNERTT